MTYHTFNPKALVPLLFGVLAAAPAGVDGVRAPPRSLLNRRGVTVAANADPENPGLAMALSNAGIEYARTIGIPILEKTVQDLAIPGASTYSKGFKVSVYELSATSVDLGGNSVATHKDGLQLLIDGGEIELSGRFHYRQKSFPNLKDTGKINVGVYDINVGTTISTSVTDTKKVQLAVEQCSADIGKVNVEIHGGWSTAITKLFEGQIASQIKSSLLPYVCTALKTVMGFANTQLDTIPNEVKIDDFVGIDFGLTTAPITSEAGIWTPHQGRFCEANDTAARPPITPVALTTPKTLPRMMYFWVTEFLGASAGWAYGQAGRLGWNVKPGPNFRLNTTNFTWYCPQLPRMYPNLPMTMNLNVSAEIPFVPKVSKGVGMNVTGYFDATFFVNLPNATRKEVFSLNVTTVLASTLWVGQTEVGGERPEPDANHGGAGAGGANTTRSVLAVPGWREPRSAPRVALRYNLTLVEIGLTLARSDVGNCNINWLAGLLKLSLTSTTVAQLNVAGLAGIPIPTMAGVRLVQPEIVFEDGAVRIDTDIEFQL